MKAIQPYLNFDGNTREAMTFYHECLGGAIQMQTFAEAKADAPPGGGDRILHARIESGGGVLMASDTMPGMKFVAGNNCHLTIDCENVAEIDRLFAAVGAGGTVAMPLQDTFWGARFGMLTDKFGIHWMFNCELSRPS